MAPRSSAWVRRGLLAGVLAVAAVLPGHAAGSVAPRCAGPRCGAAGKLSWVRTLPGSWVADEGIGGTVPSQGEAYAADGGQLAAVGFGTTVAAYQVRTGDSLWTASLDGFPAGSSISSIRAWPQVVTAGVAFPRARGGGIARAEVVLDARTGQRIRSYPAAAYGGAVAADGASTVVVGTTAVTSYDNSSGQVAWSRPTGPVPQAWRQDQGFLYVTVAADGYLGAAPVTALRRISLRTGAERIIRPHGSPFAPPAAASPVTGRAAGAFDGTFSGAFDGVVLFSETRGLSAYSGATGRLLWYRRGVVPQSTDEVRQTEYVSGYGKILGLSPQTGIRLKGTSVPGSAGLYGVRGGVALGLDHGAQGDAWGYDMATRRVVWTTPSLPWPHYFIDLSGMGGSADPASSTVLLASCAELGATVTSGPGQSGQTCLRPQLVAFSR